MQSCPVLAKNTAADFRVPDFIRKFARNNNDGTRIMWILVCALIVLGIVALGAGSIRRKQPLRKTDNEEATEQPEAGTSDGECCGQHEICEKESLLSAVSKQIEYYDDEELDEYPGMDADAYTEEQVEQFRDILYTMRQDDVAGWCRSLQLRKIEIPDAIKDEIFLIVGECRGNNVK